MQFKHAMKLLSLSQLSRCSRSKVLSTKCRSIPFSPSAYGRCHTPTTVHKLSRRWQSSDAKIQYAASGKPIYPERLLIYHAGTGKTALIGMLKLTTIALFGFSCLIVAPAYYYAPEQPVWAAPAVIALGSIPLLFTSLTTRPFVAYIHLHLPPTARATRQSLTRYTSTLPRTAALDITSLRFLPWQKIRQVQVGELREVKRRVGIANLEVLLREESRRRLPWWVPKGMRGFYVGGGEAGKGKGSRAPGIWEEVLKAVRRNDAGQEQVKKA